MEEVYIAYFDYLGFKEFIQNNEDNKIIKRVEEHIFRNIELALSQGVLGEPRNGKVFSDLSKHKINCLNISDTVIFWSNDLLIDSLKELIQVAKRFNISENLSNFPVRGAVIKGTIRFAEGQQRNQEGSIYSVFCPYGKGFVNAHIKAQAQNWAGTVIDNAIVTDLMKYDEISLLEDVAIKYKIPYKNEIDNDEEYVFRFYKGTRTKESFQNIEQNILEVFQLDNKSIENVTVQKKLNNTLEFIRYSLEIQE